MPRPPILEVADWRAILAAGKTYREWVMLAESVENAAKIERLRENQQIPSEVQGVLQNLQREVHTIAFAEDWCGDVVKFVPVLQKLVESTERVAVRYFWRESFPEIFGRYLTNGGEAIPKFVFLNDAFVECGNWGPMPADCKLLIAKGKASNKVPLAREKVTSRLAADPQNAVAIAEMMELIQLATVMEP